MSAQTTSGTSLGISLPLPATEDAAGYDALTFKVVGEITNIGDYGRVYTEITTDPLAKRRTGKYKGNYDEGSPTFTVNRDSADLGQVDVKSALALDGNAAFAITHQDGSIDYFSGKVMSFTNSVGGVKMYEASMQIGIDTDIVEKAAP